MIISRKKLARLKVEQIKSGYSAFTESKEVAVYMKKELEKLGIPVYEDATDIGFWFIPQKKVM
ncbi:hypothetical protein AWH56_014230 [Anaerobacillus isosaccharinicus]|uniref:Uncharacterized protein n=1 Tax=Anaerobacillus isosaccharinicus TaxID=1532552 RepID=A0A1S2LW62_9BACI|nr:hypothetical protein [Anaerobacillus isosaccharinicus]MBA5587945.1 hypothetical protein [Anaerobacillus isosaccharinicus]QOY33906.1 hypothetical protein AWH56_014230 [Anaerobacillus isosaccharinicus]